jgi:hypothetical protein
MKLYRTKAWSGDTANECVWDGTQASATKTRKELKQRGFNDVETEDIDVPTSKPELLEWLNEQSRPGE